MYKDELVDILHYRAMKKYGKGVIRKKDLAAYPARKLYGAWIGYVVRGEERCGIFEQIVARRTPLRVKKIEPAVQVPPARRSQQFSFMLHPNSSK